MIEKYSQDTRIKYKLNLKTIKNSLIQAEIFDITTPLIDIFKYVFHIITIFYSMNILEEQSPNQNELQQCKMAYLQSENQWMARQQNFINDLIYKYKQIIALIGQSHSGIKIEEIRDEIKRGVEKKKEEYLSTKEKEAEIEQEISDEQFFTLITSFEQKIMRLQGSIKDRQAQLQHLEQSKNKELGVRQKTFDFKYLGSVETNGKLIDKVKNEVNKLKIEKKRLENKLLICKEDKKEEEESTLPSKMSKQRKTIWVQEEEMSIFQKIVMVIKKKRFSNEAMEQKIRKLKNKLASKRVINDSLKKEIEKMEWGCFDNMQSCNGYLDSSYAAQDISIFDRTFMNNNASFSFDVSRFIKPK